MLSLFRSTMSLWLVTASLLWLQLRGQAAAADWRHLLERGWFSLARQAAATEAARRTVAETVMAVDQASRQRTAWIEQADRWRLVWKQPEVAATVSQTDRLAAWGSRYGLHLVSLAAGRPLWGGGPAGGGPLFPRLRPVMQTDLPQPGRPGPVALAAGRLVGLVDRLVAGSSAGPLLAALDLAPAAEGRLVWARELDPNLPPAAAGLAVTSAACFVAWPDATAATLELISLAAVDGGLQWRRSLSLPAGFDRQQDGPVLVTCAQHLLVVALPGGLLVGVAADTGSECWRTTLPAGDDTAAGLIIDGLTATADGLVVLRRQAAGRSGQPEICRLSLLDGQPAEQFRPLADLQAAAEDATVYGLPLVRGGHVIWPTRQPSAEAAARLLICRLPVGPTAAAGAQEPPPLGSRFADIVAGGPTEPAVADKVASSRRLVVNAGEGLWCLEPTGREPATVQSELH